MLRTVAGSERYSDNDLDLVFHRSRRIVVECPPAPAREADLRRNLKAYIISQLDATSGHRAGARFLYICEDGLVHYCSQQRGKPGVPLEAYERERMDEEGAREKPCAPYCTVSCAHQAAMLDSFRANPRQVLLDMIESRRDRNPAYRPPVLLGILTWMFLESRTNRVLSRLALRLLKARSWSDITPPCISATHRS